MKLADKWYDFWRSSGGPRLEREVRVCPERRWRADFAWRERKIFFEVDGGEFVFGRHSRRLGADAEKLNYAQLLGWRMLKFPTSLVREDYVRRVCGRLLSEPKRGVRPPKKSDILPKDGGKRQRLNRGSSRRPAVHKGDGTARREASREVAQHKGHSYFREEGLPVWSGKEEG